MSKSWSRFWRPGASTATTSRRADCIAALTQGQVEDGRRAVATARAWASTAHESLDRKGSVPLLDSPLYLGGVRVRGGGILDPVKLVDGLSAKRSGSGSGVRAEPASSVRAARRIGSRPRRAASARGARCSRPARTPTIFFPASLQRFIPLYDYILVSEPLTPDQRAAIGWRGREGVTDGRNFFNYYRLTADDRILWGTSEAAYFAGNRVGPDCDHSPAHYAALRVSFRRHFPALAPLEFPYAWGGPICSTTRLTPFFGSAMGGRVLYGLGYTGHGLGTTRLAGRILAHLALDRPTELLDLALVRKTAVSLSAGAVAFVGRGRGDPGAAPGGCRGAAGSAAAAAGPYGYRVFELREADRTIRRWAGNADRGNGQRWRRTHIVIPANKVWPGLRTPVGEDPSLRSG